MLWLSPQKNGIMPRSDANIKAAKRSERIFKIRSWACHCFDIDWRERKWDATHLKASCCSSQMELFICHYTQVAGNRMTYEPPNLQDFIWHPTLSSSSDGISGITGSPHSAHRILTVNFIYYQNVGKRFLTDDTRMFTQSISCWLPLDT